jgi:hypothetical protein
VSARLKSETLDAAFYGTTHNVLNYDYQYQRFSQLGENSGAPFANWSKLLLQLRDRAPFATL